MQGAVQGVCQFLRQRPGLSGCAVGHAGIGPEVRGQERRGVLLCFLKGLCVCVAVAYGQVSAVRMRRIFRHIQLPRHNVSSAPKPKIHMSPKPTSPHLPIPSHPSISPSLSPIDPCLRAYLPTPALLSSPAEQIPQLARLILRCELSISNFISNRRRVTTSFFFFEDFLRFNVFPFFFDCLRALGLVCVWLGLVWVWVWVAFGLRLVWVPFRWRCML